MNPRLLPDSLWLLLWLNARSRLRRIRQGLRTGKGVVAWLAAGFVIFGWVGLRMSLRKAAPIEGDVLRLYVPASLFVMCLLNLINMRPDQGIPFRPAEIEFLFPGPFSRRELLLYRVVANSLMLAIPALMITVFVSHLIPHWPGGFAGAWFGLQFVTLFQMVQTSVAAVVRERAIRRGRKWFVIAATILAMALVTIMRYHSLSLPELIRLVSESPSGQFILAPFQVFGRIMGAESLSAVAGWSTVAALMELGMLLVILRLDANWLEASVSTSQRIYEQMQRVRQGRIAWWKGNINTQRRRVPHLPRLGGAGPIAWRQLTSAQRSIGGVLMTVLIISLAPLLPMLYLDNDNVEAPAALGMLILSLFVIPQFLQFDFRGDVDRMDVLRTLPSPPLAIVAGQLVAPVLTMTALQLVFCVLMLAGGFLQPLAGLIALLFLLPANLLIFGIENLVFLWYPYRLPMPGTVDVQATFRHVLLMMLKMVMTMTLGGLAAALGGFASYLTGGSMTVFVAVSWLAATVAAGGILPLAAQAFENFDPSRDRA